MLEQVSNSVKFLAFYTASKQGKTGLTVTVDLYDPSGTQIVTGGSATAVGGGLYSYTLTSNNSSEGEYTAIFKTTDSTVDAQHIPSLWVLGRAGVENLDAATSTRLASSGYTAPANSDISAIKAKTDALPSDPADQSLVESAITALSIPTVVQIRTELDSNSTKLANLDAAISAIQAKTDNLPSDPADQSLVESAISALSIPTVVEIRTEMDSNSTQLSGIKSKTDALPSDPADQSLLEAAIAGVTAPSASTVAAAVRSELSVELARVDQAVSSRLAASEASKLDAVKAKTDLLQTDRLAQCSTVATTGAQLAAALS
jgi:hypothetical protein